MHGLILSELARLSISTECIVYWASAGQTGVSWREWLVTEWWWADGVIGDRKRRHHKWQPSEPRLSSARGPSRGRHEDPGGGHPVLAGAAHQLLGPGQGQAYTPYTYTYIDTQMESRKFIPRCWNLCVYNVQRKWIFSHMLVWIQSSTTVDKLNFRSNLL